MFLVTDVTGHVGRAVVAELVAQSRRVRVLSCTSTDVPADIAKIADVFDGDLQNPADLQRAFSGVEGVFLASQLSPQMAEDHRRFVATMEAAGVERVVQLSGVGANSDMCCARALRWLAQAECALRPGKITVTRLRPTFLMQTLLEFCPSIAQQGLIAGPFRDIRWTWVDARDVAAVAVAVLRDAKHAHQTYVVTGADELTYQEVAGHLSQVLGKPVRYQDITANEARGWLQAKGVSPVMIEAKLEMWDVCASNLINVAPTTAVRDVTGREPRSLDQFLQDHRSSFLRGRA